jgi:DNA-binding response OmpR family regulator
MVYAMALILWVEDDRNSAAALTRALSEAGHVVRPVGQAAQALKIVTQERPDLVILDLGLPDIDGTDALRMMRTVSDVPVIAVTARGEAADRVRGLRSGADDYVVQPFAISELLARIDAVLRRTGLLQPRPRVTVGDLTVDIEARTVQVADKPISLTRKEFDVLAVLAAHHGRVVPREQVALYAWQSVFEASSRTMDVHVASLRAKLGRPELVQTIRGVGYRLGSD